MIASFAFLLCIYSVRAGSVREIVADVIYQRRTNRDLARVLRQPADSCLCSGGLETKPTKIQASGGRKPPDSIDIAHR